MAKDRRSRDQKRRDKLAEKARRARKVESLAYTGNKYRTEELVPFWLETEVAIYECYIITDRQLLDQAVAAALETMIRQLRAGTLPPSTPIRELHYARGEETELLIENIGHHWAEFFATKWRPSRDERIGVLRTILGSLETMRSAGPRSQSYLQHITGFLTKQLGISIKKVVSGEHDELPEPDEDELVEIGRCWAFDNDQDAKADFYELAGDLMRNGEQKRVIDACHLLIGETCDASSETGAALARLSVQASQSLITAMG